MWAPLSTACLSQEKRINGLLFVVCVFFILQIVKYIAESVSGSALINMRAAKNYEMQYRLFSASCFDLCFRCYEEVNMMSVNRV